MRSACLCESDNIQRPCRELVRVVTLDFQSYFEWAVAIMFGGFVSARVSKFLYVVRAATKTRIE